MLLRHPEGILAYWHVKVPFGVVETIKGNSGPSSAGDEVTGITTTCSSRFRSSPPRLGGSGPRES